MRAQGPSQNDRNGELGGESDNAFEERHFTIAEVAAMWNLSDEFVRQLVRDEPGVTEWVRQRPGRRRYRVLRIPPRYSVASIREPRNAAKRITQAPSSDARVGDPDGRDGLPGLPDLGFEQLLASLHPRAVMFLGDFDGRMAQKH